jgi:tetratricopeptide (TPR) repeat protein
MRCLLLILIAVPYAHAGLYYGDQRPTLPRLDRVREEILMRRAVAKEPPGRLDPDSPRAQILRVARRLEISQSQGLLSTPERVSLGAAYIRLGRLPEAIRLLEAGDPSHPLLLANLATAYFDSGEYDLAARVQSRLIRNWPTVLAGWTQDELSRARATELAFDRLIRHRADEARRNIRREQTIDPLFPGFTLETPEGEYEPWDLPQTLRDKLPADAEDVLVRLLLSVPHDRRLYWLYGELSAVYGRIDIAARILNDLVDEGLEFQGLRRHRKVLNEASQFMRAFATREPTFRFYAVGMALGRGTLGPAGPGHIQVASAFVAPALEKEFRTEFEWEALRRVGAEAPAETPELEEDRMPFNWRHIAVSFAFGFLVAALIGFQIQEWRRRGADTRASTPDSVSSVK